MKRFDFTHYFKWLNSLDLDNDLFNPYAESFCEYIKLSDEFNPICNPPNQINKKAYILKYIVPILQEYCKDLKAILEVDEQLDCTILTIISNYIFVIEEEIDFKYILHFATSFSIKPDQDKIRLELYFHTK